MVKVTDCSRLKDFGFEEIHRGNIAFRKAAIITSRNGAEFEAFNLYVDEEGRLSIDGNDVFLDDIFDLGNALMLKKVTS